VHVCVCMHLSFFLSFLSSSLSFFFSLSFTHLPTYLTVIYLSIYPPNPSIHPSILLHRCVEENVYKKKLSYKQK
jgi:hypothetical protein